jgi:hypothetical protein
MGKATASTKKSLKKVFSSDNRLEIQRDRPDYSSVMESLEARYRKNLFFQKEKTARELKSVYDSKDRDLKNEVEALRMTLEKETEKLARASSSLYQQTKTAVSEKIEKPGNYHLGFFTAIFTLIRKVSQARKSIEESADWLQLYNQKSKKKGRFWDTYTGKRGGSKFLLSSEHYLTRSAG